MKQHIVPLVLVVALAGISCSKERDTEATVQAPGSETGPTDTTVSIVPAETITETAPPPTTTAATETRAPTTVPATQTANPPAQKPPQTSTEPARTATEEPRVEQTPPPTTSAPEPPREVPQPGAGNASQGASIFAAKCKTCHGASGAGDTAIGKKQSIRDFATSPVQQQSDAELAKIIAEGKGTMSQAAHKRASLTSEQIRDVIAYIRSLD